MLFRKTNLNLSDKRLVGESANRHPTLEDAASKSDNGEEDEEDDEEVYSYHRLTVMYDYY